MASNQQIQHRLCVSQDAELCRNLGGIYMYVTTKICHFTTLRPYDPTTLRPYVHFLRLIHILYQLMQPKLKY
jgi:hypothetical protein